ncbi:MAG: general secretion pathway protein GspK [Verrucomicrobiae bacterium]|nr:general secretion pathway protein GspK [Verrucomicrobiae bacterium]
MTPASPILRTRPGTDLSAGRARSRGSALVAILWIVSILTIAVFSATQFLFIELESDSNASSLFQAELLADRGVAIAAHAKVKKGDRLLNQSFGNGLSFSARISSEGDRLNLNSLLENAESDRIVLEELFYQWGLRREEAVDVVDNLIDWYDADDEPTNVGAERSYYYSQDRLNHPFNRPFDSLEEVALVKDFGLVAAANPSWREAFTLLSGGTLDLNEAPPELIAAACQVSFEAARKFVSIRDGLDQTPGTLDDLRFEEVESALDLLGVPVGFIDEVSARVTTEDPARRILSLGRNGAISVERSVTVQYTGDRGTIIHWETRRLE